MKDIHVIFFYKLFKKFFLVVSNGSKLYAAVNLPSWISRHQYFGILHTTLVLMKYPKMKKWKNYQHLPHSYRNWLLKKQQYKWMLLYHGTITAIRILPSNFVPQFFTWNNCNLFTNSLVCMEVVSQSCIIFLNYYSGSLLDSLCSDAPLIKW